MTAAMAAVMTANRKNNDNPDDVLATISIGSVSFICVRGAKVAANIPERVANPVARTPVIIDAHQGQVCSAWGL